MSVNDHCIDHTGCLADIKNIKNENKSQWAEMISMRQKVDSMMSKLNVILGGVVVSLILLAVNLGLKAIK